MISIIDWGTHRDYSMEALKQVYQLKPLRDDQVHHLALMYRLSRDYCLLQEERPEIVLGNRNKIKFNVPSTKLEKKVMKSPFHRGVKLWDMLTEEVQKATTRVKLKNMITNKLD